MRARKENVLKGRLGIQARHARAALMTAIAALEGKSLVEAQIATSLRVHVLAPLEAIEKAVDGEGGVP